MHQSPAVRVSLWSESKSEFSGYYSLQEQMPKLPGPLLSAVTICLMEARPRGYAPLGLHADVPNIPQGLADGSSQLAQDDRWPPLICPYTPLQELHTNFS